MICAGIRYWESEGCIEKATMLQRTLRDAMNSFLDYQKKLARGAAEEVLAIKQQEAELYLKQTIAMVYTPDIDDALYADNNVTDENLAPFMPKTFPEGEITFQDLVDVTMGIFERAIILNDPDDTDNATKLIARAMRKASFNKESPRYLACLAYMEFGQGHLENAKETFNKSLLIAPDRAETYLLRAMMYFSIGNSELAQPDIERAEILNKGNIYIMSLHGDIAFELGDLETSKQLHRAVLEKCPTFRRSLMSLAVISLETNEPTEAYPHLCVLLRSEPLNWFALSCLGDVYFSQVGHAFKAIPFYAMSIIAGSEEPLVFLNLVRLVMYLGKYREAQSLIHEFYEVRKRSDNDVLYRFKQASSFDEYREEIGYLQLTCDLIINREEYINNPGQLKQQLSVIHADDTVRRLANILLDYASIDYSDSMKDIAKRSVCGIETLKSYIMSTQSRTATSGEVVMMSAVIRMAIWNGFYAEANAFLRLLNQSNDAVLVDTCALLEKEMFEYDSMARQAHTNMSLFHILSLGADGDEMRTLLEHGKGSSLKVPPTWRTQLTTSMGLHVNPEWSALLIESSSDPVVKSLFKSISGIQLDHIAPRVMEVLDFVNRQKDKPWSELCPQVTEMLIRDHFLTRSTPATTAILSFLEVWLSNEQSDIREHRPLKAYWCMLRMVSPWKIVSKEVLGCDKWNAANDNIIDKNNLNQSLLTNMLRPRYFDDSSLLNRHDYRSMPLVELTPENSRDIVMALSECYAEMYERASTDEALGEYIDPEISESFYQILRLLHGGETDSDYVRMHKTPRAFMSAKETIKALAADPGFVSQAMAFSEFRPRNAKFHIFPRSAFPSSTSLIRIQTPPEFPVACDVLRQPIPGNLITWNDLRELFHNYAVWAIEEALERNNDEALLPLLDPDFNFTFFDFANPSKPLKTVEEMHVALSQCLSDCQKHPANRHIMILHGHGNIGIKFTEQFEVWSEAHANELIRDCIQLESCVYLIDVHNAFETRCRIQSILNRYPFLSRLYILEAAVFSSLGDRKQAQNAIKTGLSWEDKLYAGVGWEPIHPDPDDPAKEKAFEPISNDPNEDLPYKIWVDNFMDINHENELSYFYSNWNSKFKMRTRRPLPLLVMMCREMNFDKAGAFDFYRLFSGFLRDVPHIEDIYYKAMSTPGIWDLREYLRYVIQKTDSNKCFEFHRQLAELLIQIYPLEDDMLNARFCSDNGFSLNALFHACTSLATTHFNDPSRNTFSACELIGASLYDMGYITEACRFLEMTLKNPVPSPQGLLTLGCAYIEDQRYQEAIEILSRGREIDRFNDRFYFNEALAHIELSQFEEAERCLRDGIEIARAPFDLGLQLLRVFIHTERIHEAVDLATHLDGADHNAFCDAMNSLEFGQFVQLKPIRALLNY